MSYLTEIFNLPNAKQLEFFIQNCSNTKEIQQSILKEIVRKNQSTEIGKKFNFEKIKSYEDFKTYCPVTHWNLYENYSEKMKDGEKNLLFNDDVEYFTQTSGTTGKMKFLPESTMGKKVKQLVTSLRISILFGKYPEILKGKYLPLVNSGTVGYTKANIPFGTASGITMKNISKDLLKFNACPLEIQEISDMETVDYLTMRFAVEQDVRMIATNNAGRIESLVLIAQKYMDDIIEDIRNGSISKKLDIPDGIYKKLNPYLKPNPDRADEIVENFNIHKEFLPVVYWPNLILVNCWLSGSVGKYVKKSKSFFKNYEREVVFFDGGYGASELKINIPYEPNNSGGLLANFAGFFEFIPTDSDYKVLLAHQLEKGKEYRLIVTTYSGLYRYDMKDIIKVEGFKGDNPIISFVSKTADIGNICGEKVTSALILDVADKFFDFKIRYFCAVADADRHKYILCIEPEDEIFINEEELDVLIDEIENYIFVINDIYKVFREQGLIGKMEIKFMPKGWYNKIISSKVEKGTPVNQIKLPVIYNSFNDLGV